MSGSALIRHVDYFRVLHDPGTMFVIKLFVPVVKAGASLA